MTLVSYNPSWWPSIYSYRISSYFVVAGSAGVMYDWVLTFGQEVELVWRQHWSLMTVLYLSVRYLGISYAVINMLIWVPTISMTDTGCFILNFAENWMGVVVYVMLGVILIARLHAMYQQSRKVMIFLIVIFLAVDIFDGVVVAISVRNSSWEELILSGTSQCTVGSDDLFLHSITWILTTVWEALAFFLTVWIAIKHFRELRQHSAGGIIRDCFAVLVETHIVYFASVVVVSCFDLGYFFSTMSADTFALGTQIYFGLLDIFQLVRMFILGPRLILGVREYQAKFAMAGPDTGTDMTSVAFQERVHVSTSSTV